MIPRSISLLLPYAAVLIGLHAAGSAWLAFGLYHLGILVILGKTGWLRRAHELLRGWQTVIGVGAIVFGIGGGVLLWLLGPRAGIGAGLRPELAEIGLSGAGWIGFIAYHVIVNGWFEELYWRGYLGSDTRRITLPDVAFAGYHLLVLGYFLAWPWLVPAFVTLLLAAWAWRELVRRSGGLLMAVVSHVVADAAVLIAIELVMRR